MNKPIKREGIELFKLIAAVLVVATFTSPLVSLSNNIDFILTGILARIAIPFFIMIVGYDIIPRCLDKTSGNTYLRLFIVRLCGIYITITLLYLPFYIFEDWNCKVGNMAKDILWEGIMCNLWYFPALFTGVLIAVILLKKLSLLQVNIMVTLLYIVALFGDSYYGFSQKNEVAASFYQLIFHITNYTRNGLLYMPIFLIMGYNLTRMNSLSKNKCRVGLLLSLAAMTVEGIVLHLMAVQRYDSMYLFLIPTMYFLFEYVLQWECNVVWQVDHLAELIYILTPFSIILVKWISRISRTDIMTINSLIYFYFVLMITVLLSLLVQLGFMVNKKNENSYHKWKRICN